jgi:hypothetical protein
LYWLIAIEPPRFLVFNHIDAHVPRCIQVLSLSTLLYTPHFLNAFLSLEVGWMIMSAKSDSSTLK